MGKIELDHTGSGSGITLSSDGTSLLLGGTAIGGGDPDLYKDNASSATTPVASGTNALALGNTAVASGENAFAIGSDTDATGSNSLALGKGAQAVSTRCLAMGLNASASADRAISIGNNGNVATGTYATSIGSGSSSAGSTAAGSGSVALSNARAGGSDSFAATITSNTSTYGAIGTNSIAIGRLAKASTTGGNAIGWGATSTHEYASAFGVNATTTTSHQVALAGTNHTVLISGAYKLPTADGSANQVLTTNGSGQLSFAAAAGGPDLFAENWNGTTTQPSATGVNAVAIGTSSNSTGTGALSAPHSNAGGDYSFAAAIGNSTSSYGSQGNNSVAFGQNPLSNGLNSAALGANAQAIGTGSSAVGQSYSSGSYAFAAAINNNTSSYGATGANSIAMGYQAKANNSYATVSGGASNVASGYHSTVIGGSSNLADNIGSTVLGGRYGTTRGIRGAAVFGGYGNQITATQGTSQSGLYILAEQTTDATATDLKTDNQSSSSTANQIVLPNGGAYAFHGTIVGREASSSGTECAAWRVEGLIRREGSAGTTVLVNSATTVLNNAPSWGMSLSANTSLGCLKIEVTGAAKTIRWVGSITTTELTFA